MASKEGLVGKVRTSNLQGGLTEGDLFPGPRDARAQEKDPGRSHGVNNGRHHGPRVPAPGVHGPVILPQASRGEWPAKATQSAQNCPFPCCGLGHRAGDCCPPIFSKPRPPWTPFPGAQTVFKGQGTKGKQQGPGECSQRSHVHCRSSGLGTTQHCPTFPLVIVNSLPEQAASV